jgi:hypothetical protein
MNYNVFDPFLACQTWHTSHPLDEQRFFKCLSKVVDHPDFNPESMGDYIRGKQNIDTDEHHFTEAVHDLVRKAWAVYDYLKANE